MFSGDRIDQSWSESNRNSKMFFFRVWCCFEATTQTADKALTRTVLPTIHHSVRVREFLGYQRSGMRFRSGSYCLKKIIRLYLFIFLQFEAFSMHGNKIHFTNTCAHHDFQMCCFVIAQIYHSDTKWPQTAAVDKQLQSPFQLKDPWFPTERRVRNTYLSISRESVRKEVWISCL